MLPPKNVGIFGEYEERQEKQAQRLLLQMTIQKYVDALGDYPDHEDPANKMLLDMMLDIVMKQFNRVCGEDDESFDAERD
jgi:hypothetical protein